MKHIYSLILGLACALATTANNPIDIFAEYPQTKNANIGICIRNLKTGEIIDSYRPNNAIPPASVIKLLTTASALEMLGADSCISTTLEYTGTIDGETLKGDLYIYGHGDPMLGSHKTGQNFFNDWVRAVRQAGITRIEGCVIADMSFFDADALNPGWLWEDAGNYYAPGVFALSYLDNTMNIQLRSGPIGTLAEVLSTVPQVPEIEFENHIRCTKIEGDGAFVSGTPYSFRRLLTGSVPSNEGSFGIKGDLPNPGLLLAQHFTDRLNEAGITVQGKARYIAENDLLPRTILYVHQSLPLSEIVKQTNQHSVNLYAESLFRLLASNVDLPCTITNAEAVIRACWRNRGVDLSSSTIKDGCGLAPQDAISAEAFVQLLTYMEKKSNAYNAFYASLPVSGKTGTLRSFLVNTPLEGRVHAKSGTISGTKNYAGYIDLPNGEQWVFAIMVNSAIGKARGIQTVIEKYLLDVYKRNQ